MRIWEIKEREDRYEFLKDKKRNGDWKNYK